MKVKELRKQLECLPQNLEIYWADHDHGEFETGSKVGKVKLIDKRNMTEHSNDNDYGYSDCFKHTPQRYVLFRP